MNNLEKTNLNLTLHECEHNMRMIGLDLIQMQNRNLHRDLDKMLEGAK